jgi:hypothetical protein
MLRPAKLSAGLPLCQFIALGLPAEDAALRALAKTAGVELSANMGPEGYALAVTADCVSVLGNTVAGVFRGAQSLLQLAESAPNAVPACTVQDWPDFPIRGAYMFGAPRWPLGLDWNKKLVDWMAAHKMNFGVVVNQGFYGEVPGLESNQTEAAVMRTQLQDLHQYMRERHVEFVPTLASGSGGGPEYFNPATAEGKWVRNVTFIFDEETDQAVPETWSLVNSSHLNGDFAQLGSDHRPTGWTFGPSTGQGAPKQWSMVEGDAPVGSKTGRSMRCEMAQISCSAMPPSGRCQSEDMSSPAVAVTGGSVLQITIWAKMTAFKGPSARFTGPQITAVPVDANGGSLSYASINLTPAEATTYNISDWHQYNFGITTLANTTSISFYTRLQGANMTATWSIADVGVIQLDNTLRNIIRTNITDIHVWNSDHSKQYVKDTDFAIVDPKTKNNANDCNISLLEPTIVRRLPSGGIQAGQKVLLSYDFLPGKTDVQGHSTPNAFAEPEYYAFMNNAIAAVAAAFPGIQYVNFNHDEIRGMARDSRSLLSGLSNAELLAKDMNTLQVLVKKHLGPHARAMYWDDMVNPDHNGGNARYQPETGGGRAGKTDLAILDKLISPDVLWFSWAYGVSPDITGKFSDLRKINDAPALFDTNGYDWVGSPWKDPANVHAWGKSLKAGKKLGSHALGLVDTEWGSHLAAADWGNVPDVAACAWNLDAFLDSE